MFANFLDVLEPGIYLPPVRLYRMPEASYDMSVRFYAFDKQVHTVTFNLGSGTSVICRGCAVLALVSSRRRIVAAAQNSSPIRRLSAYCAWQGYSRADSQPYWSLLAVFLRHRS